MQRVTLIAVWLLLVGASVAQARPERLSPMEVVDESAAMVMGRVVEREDGLATIDVERWLKGAGGERASVREIPARLPLTQGVRFEVGERVVLGLSDDGELVSYEESVFRLARDAAPGATIEALVALTDEVEGNDAAARAALRDRLAAWKALSDTARLLLMEAIQEELIGLNGASLDETLRRGLDAESEDVRWRALVAARERRRTMLFADAFLGALESESRRIRAAGYEALRQEAGASLGYDPAVRGEDQRVAIARWREWIASRG